MKVITQKIYEIYVKIFTGKHCYFRTWMSEHVHDDWDDDSFPYRTWLSLEAASRKHLCGAEIWERQQPIKAGPSPPPQKKTTNCRW